MKQVWIVQPYVPQYRVEFFERLAKAVAVDDIDLRVVAARASGPQAARGDAATPSWLSLVDPRVYSAAGRNLVLTSTANLWRDADAVVLPLMGSSLDSYRALARKRRHGLAVGLWGHVANYTTTGSRLDLWLEKHQMRRCDQVFAYTEGGAAFARRQGIPRSHITVLRNTVDLDEVVSAAAHVSEDDVAEFRSQHGVTNNRVLAFIGGIDESKRIDFLRDVLDRLWVVDPSVQILIGGRGTQEGLLSEAVGRGQAVLLGQVGATRKVLMARASTLLVSPGRVGLVAAEALALKLHVVTTRWPFHAPEFEYLAEGIDVTQTVDDVNIYADEILRLLDEGPPVVQSRPPLLDDMVSAFRAGLLRMGI